MINFYKTLMNSNRETNSHYLINNSSYKKLETSNCKIEKCPYCNNKDFIKYGMYKNIQRYKCKDNTCGKTFTDEIYNKFRYSKKFKEKHNEYFDLLNEGLTLRECAKKLNITVVTAFFWRHRFLFDFKNKYYIEKITSYVELTKMVILENFKGSRDIPFSNRDKLTVIHAINDFIDIVPIITSRNFFGFYEIRDNLIPRLDKQAYVVGLIDGRLKTFSQAFNKINKVKIIKTSENHIDIKYSTNSQKWLSKFRGVASKYLDHYLYWRLFDYENNLQYKIDNHSIVKAKNEVYFTSEINTYISWNNIKLKTLPI